MRRGVIIVGLNGSGKTTLGRALAERLGFFPMDVEDYYFIPSENPYAVSRTKDEARRLMIADIDCHPAFVLSSVNGDWGQQIESTIAAAICLSAPRETRLARIDQRSIDRFGARVLPGGSMYEQERRFREMAAERTEAPIEAWLENVSFPVLRLNADRTVEESLEIVVDWLRNIL